jgi:hypothetical protein
MVATALQTSIMIMGEMTSTSARMAIPSASRVLASCRILSMLDLEQARTAPRYCTQRDYNNMAIRQGKRHTLLLPNALFRQAQSQNILNLV